MINLLFKEKHRNMIFLLVIYLLFLPLLNVQGTVLCFGKDGHVALEKASSDFECESILNLNTEQINNSERSDFIIEKKIDDARHCGDCEDIAISRLVKDQHLVSFYDFQVEKDIYRLPLIIFAGYEHTDKNIHFSYTTTFLRPSTPITQSTVIRC